MTVGGVALPGAGRSFPYAGRPTSVLAELPGFAVVELVVPPLFAGPIPHVHHDFDEGIYVIDGELMLTVGHEEPVPAPPGSFCLAPRGIRHTFSNPTDQEVSVLGVWSPGAAGLAFMADVGALIPASGGPDPALVAEAYARHASELLP
jgi:mannose-6-phosphate isomerase-like protein (cupin superfamily)